MKNEQSKDTGKVNFKFLMSYTWKDISQRKCYFCLCLISCFIASIVALISNTVLNQAPIIFVMIAQQNEGEIDVVVTPTPFKVQEYDIKDQQIFYGMLNFTLFNQVMKSYPVAEDKNDAVTASSRLILSSKGRKLANETGLSLDITVIDSVREEIMEVGRKYEYKEIDEGACLIHLQTAQKLSIEENSTMLLTFDTEAYVKNLAIFLYGNDTRLYQLSNITSFQTNMSCVVRGIMNETYGKFGKEKKNFVLMENKYFVDQMTSGFNKQILNIFPNLPSDIKNKGIKAHDISNQIIINFAKPRLNFYLASNYDKLQKDTSEYVKNIVIKIGMDDHVKYNMPIVNQMKNLYYGAVFLGLILNLIIFILFLLSIVLIYSLLVLTLETNSAELGVLRLIGSTKLGIILLVIIECLMFSLPAFLLSFFCHFFVLMGIQFTLKYLTGADLILNPDVGAVFLAFILTNLAPLVAAGIPIKELITKNLASSINSAQSKTSGVKVEIVSASENERYTLVIFGLLTVVYGLSIYYFLPQALLSNNLGLLLAIFMWILLGMLLGFILLSLNIEHLMQKACNFLLFFWAEHYKKIIILKNLSAHRLRNRKTSLMYSLSVGFFIMINVGMNIEIQSMKLEMQKGRGVYYRLEMVYGFLKAGNFRASIDYMLENKLIEDYSFITPSMRTAQTRLKSTRIGNLGKSLDYSIDVYGLSYNFYNTTINDFLTISAEDNIDLPISEKAYLRMNDGNMAISEYYEYNMNVKLKEEFFVFLDDSKSTNQMRFLFRSSYILNNSPVIRMDYNPSSDGTRAVTIPFHTYINILNKCYNFFYSERDPYFQPFAVELEDIPISNVLLKLNENWTSEELSKIDKVVNLDPNYVINIWNYNEHKQDIEDTGNIINYMFTGVSLIVMIFCYFNLSSTMTINIFEQTKEIAVFRSLGLTKNGAIFVYVAEAIVLIFSSSIVGFIIGSILAFTMTIQRSLFTHLPITYIFPTQQFILIIVVSIVGGVLSTYFPARKLLKKEISDIIRS